MRSIVRPPKGGGRKTDCHVAPLLAMTVVIGGWSLWFCREETETMRAILESPLLGCNYYVICMEIVPYTKNVNMDIAKKRSVRYNKNW